MTPPWLKVDAITGADEALLCWLCFLAPATYVITAAWAMLRAIGAR